MYRGTTIVKERYSLQSVFQATPCFFRKISMKKLMMSFGTFDMLVVFFGVMFVCVDITFIRPKAFHKKVIEHLNVGGEGIC